MKAFVASLLLLSACATAPVVKAPARWPAALVYTVVGTCGRAGLGDLRQCGCFAEQLERVSPDPRSQATEAEIVSAMAACGLEAPKAEPEVGVAL